MKAGVSKSFLKSSTAKGLERKLLKFSASMGGFIEYQIIFANDEWYAWFNVDLLEKLKVEINEERVSRKENKNSGVGDAV